MTISSDINGWYFENLVFGGFIGFLIVDPITGAMYKLERTDLNEILATEGRIGLNNERTLEIIDINKIPESLRGDWYFWYFFNRPGTADHRRQTTDHSFLNFADYFFLRIDLLEHPSNDALFELTIRTQIFG